MVEQAIGLDEGLLGDVFGQVEVTEYGVAAALGHVLEAADNVGVGL